MRTSIRFAALFACSVLVACSGDDAGTAPEEDTGSAEETSVDSSASETEADTGTDDSSLADSGETDSGSSDSTLSDSTSSDSSGDSTSDATSSDSVGSDSGSADSGSDGGADTKTDAPSDTGLLSDGGSDAPSDAAGDSGKPCSFTGGGCSATEYCDTPTCDMGTCKPRPATAAKEYAPACGCDGVTYWNQSTAASTGHGSYPGKCALDGSGVGTTKFCGIMGCGPSEVCIQDLTAHGSCGLGGFGKSCWRLVSGGTCPKVALDLPKVRECSGGTSGGCTGYCKAVLAEDSGGITGFLEDSTCP